MALSGAIASVQTFAFAFDRQQTESLTDRPQLTQLNLSSLQTFGHSGPKKQVYIT